MDFRVLGPLEVRDVTGRPGVLEPRHARLLAVLLLSANQVVTRQQLVDGLWDEDPPATAARQVRNLVSSLRRRLAGSGASTEVIVTDGPGYRIVVGEGQLDATAFTGRVERARTLASSGEPAAAVRELRAALALWRGPALAGLTGRVIETGATRLAEQRLAATEQCVDLELRLGRHHDLIGELTELVATHPTRERLVGQLMLALRRCGRQSEALDTYHRLRTRLAEELGLDPGAAIRDLHTAILRDDTGAPGPPAPGRQQPAPVRAFVGRDEELTELLAHLERVRTGEPRLVLVEGAAGIGKTALVRQFLSVADGAWVLRVSGDENEARLPYGLVGQLAEQLPAALATSLGEPGDAGARPDPLAVGSALLEVLGDLQEGGPVVVVVDDAQWGDIPSLGSLTFVLRRLRVDRVMTVVITRDAADPRLPEGLRRLLADADTSQLVLAGLAVTELRTLSGLLGQGPLTPRAADRLRAHTEGNPLHACALLKQLPAEALADTHVPLPAPRSYEQLVLARLAACGPEGRRLVEAAGVLGRSCALHLAAELGGVDDPLTALEHTAAAGLVTSHQARVGLEIRFTHPLVRAAVYQSIGPTRQAGLHRRAAELTAGELTRLHHRVLATDRPDHQLAAELATVGRRDAADGLWANAAERLAQAARLADADDERTRLIAEAVEAMLFDGRLGEAGVLAAELDQRADPAVRGYVLGALAHHSGRLRDADGLLTEAWRHCDPTADPALASRIAEQLGFLELTLGRPGDGVVWAERALELSAHRPGADRLRSNYLISLAADGQIERGLAFTDNLPGPADADVGELDALLGRGFLLIFTDELDRSVRLLAEVVTACGSRSLPFRLTASALLTLAEYRLGNWDDALVHAESGTSLATDSGLSWVAALAHGFAALVPAARGDWDSAARHVRAAQRGVGEAPSAGAMIAAGIGYAHLLAAKGDDQRLIADLAPTLGAIATVGDPSILLWHDLVIDALIAVGDVERAEKALVPYEKLARTRRRRSALAAAARLWGALWAARGRPDAARAAYEEALAHSAHVRNPFDRARLEVEYGAFLSRNGSPAAAVEHLDTARTVLDRLGAQPQLERCERELVACGHHPASRRSPRAAARLSTQEQTIARLAATGMTNHQIARDLFLSIRTIEHHLGRIYARLEVTSPSGLASRLAT